MSAAADFDFVRFVARDVRRSLATLPSIARLRLLTTLIQEAAEAVASESRAPVAKTLPLSPHTGADPAFHRGATQRQMVVLNWIADYIAKNGVSPTLREIGAGLGIRSTNGVNDHIRALERRGLIERLGDHDRATHRGLRIVSAGTR